MKLRSHCGRFTRITALWPSTAVARRRRFVAGITLDDEARANFNSILCDQFGPNVVKRQLTHTPDFVLLNGVSVVGTQ